MIGIPAVSSLPTSTLKRLMRERSLDPDEKVAAIALLTSLDASDNGVIRVAEDYLAERLGMTTRKLRLALGTLWALGYLDMVHDQGIGGELQIMLGTEAER